MNTLIMVSSIILALIVVPPLLCGFAYLWWTSIISLSIALAHKFSAYLRDGSPEVPFCKCYICRATTFGQYNQLPKP
jgi:hypothetical protein